jgi:hypothetical protein
LHTLPALSSNEYGSDNLMAGWLGSEHHQLEQFVKFYECALALD